MAAETGSPPTFEADRELWWRRVKGRLFEGALVVATLFGLLALVALFVLIGADAFGVDAASPEWYLVYLGTLVGPIGAYTLYVRRRPAMAEVNARSYVVVFGCLAFSLVAFAVPDALGPRDVGIHTVFTLGPPAFVLAYARLVGENQYTGPAIPISTLLGLLAGFLLYDLVAPVVALAADWVLYAIFVPISVALILGEIARRRRSQRAAVVTVSAVLGAVGLTVVVALVRGVDPSLWLVLVGGFVAPVAFFTVDTLHHNRNGAAGLLGPYVLVGGMLAGAWLVSFFDVSSIETWLTPTLLLDSWSDFRPRQAGIYPQLIGSIVLVGLMALLAFPVGVGAAIYLEEYAASTGWRGRLASVLDVNISNLAGVPSVVYGLLGLALFRQGFGLTPGILIAGAVTLGLLILPIVIVAAQEALRSVPDEYRNASYGLGASRWQTVRNVVLPEAVPGILTGTILALGRAIGETAPLVMLAIATTRFSPPDGIFSGATALPLQIFAAKGNNIPEYRTGVVAAAAVVLLALMLLMNAAAILIRNRYQKRDKS
ncbi:phosphate ABC transporter, permease protein PstA [Halovivax ruber XH-70]|uniref:Phosphate transport system permease protein PstA n=1 Tax=Halovivax ruber (strain DSM 18193 / JCM 13892 / XH-70) TaxID=797302 RepID=L0I9E2_HALRX|nr:phosphate ABC transporter permease PstA [Halovivax ruber]AGB15309.1 phosphate ABC transporter, permease protein PstA [Halovivax ruber XH-70]